MKVQSNLLNIFKIASYQILGYIWESNDSLINPNL